MNPPERERLRELLRERSLRFGEFVLASGRKSSFYFDSKQTTLHPEGAYLTARCILDLVRRLEVPVRAVGGLTLGADPIVCAVTAVSHLEGLPLAGFIVRKEAKGHGTAREIEAAPEPGTPVLIVDDVVTTAGSTLKAIEAAEAAELRVQAVTCLVDREEGGAAALAAYPFHPIFRRGEILPDS
ncbi:MAG: orotate phosphoribosyltransferase [Acidobacteriota bacterium]|jgi:orotate phosphoribosyltransferase